MNYCAECQVVFESKSCPLCGSQQVNEPRPQDFVFLIQKDNIWSGVVEDILTQNNIAYASKGKLGMGVALKVGPGFERFDFFVPYDRFYEAKELMEEVFSAE